MKMVLILKKVWKFIKYVFKLVITFFDNYEFKPIFYCIIIGVLYWSLKNNYNEQYSDFLEFLANKKNDLTNDNASIVTSVFVAINCGLIAMLTISIQMDGEPFYGIKMSKYYELRGKNHFSPLELIFVFIVFSASLVITKIYSLFLTFFCIGCSLVFLYIVVVFDELPVLFRRRKKLISVVKSALHKKRKGTLDASRQKILQNVLYSLMCEKTLGDIYNEV